MEKSLVFRVGVDPFRLRLFGLLNEVSQHVYEVKVVEEHI